MTPEDYDRQIERLRDRLEEMRRVARYWYIAAKADERKSPKTSEAILALLHALGL